MPKHPDADEVLRPDSKGRIALGKRAAGVSSYLLEEGSDGSLILHPRTEIPVREAWLFKNREALASVRRGLRDSAAGRTASRGSFSQYADDSPDDDSPDDDA